jgi:hypothetical protein
MIGGVVSTTVTFDVQMAVFPEVSFAVHVNGSLPSGNVDASGGLHPVDCMPQLSKTLPISFVTTVPAGL